LAEFVCVPPQRVPLDTLDALLEEYASRDGTDYGEQETPLERRVEQLRSELSAGRLQLLFDISSEQWDLLPADEARRLLATADGTQED
jgi:uncharacterized protein YheU (UPF0270 family)